MVNKIRCSPIVLWFFSVFMMCVGAIMLLVAFSKFDEEGIVSFIPSIAFFLLSGIGWFESLTTSMTFADYGIILEFHRVFPFSYAYPFDMLENITSKGKLVRLKHKGKFFGAERFFVQDIESFIENLKKTPFG